jgi:hypothetical protein
MFLTPEQVGALSGEYWLLAIVLMMGLAIALCLCSEADAFVAASFVTLRPSAKVAFLVLGPMLDFKLYAMYTRIFRPRLILTIYTCVLSQVFIYSVITHFFWEANKERLVRPQQHVKELSKEELQSHPATRATVTVGLVGAPVPGGWHPASFAVAWGRLNLSSDTDAPEMSFLRLESAALSPELRAYYEGKLVRMTGRFVGDERQFTLLRYKINCCAADATPLRAAMYIDPASVQKGLKFDANKLSGQWVSVAGHVTFVQTGSSTWMPALVVKPTEGQGLDDLVKIVPVDSNPYIY